MTLKIKVGWNEGNRVTRGPSVKNTCHCIFLNFETCFNFKKKKKKIRMNWQDLPMKAVESSL